MGNRIGKLRNYKKMAAIVFIVTFAIILFLPLITPTAYAQGEYFCKFDNNRCTVDKDKTDCDDGFYTGICSGGDPGECVGSQSCSDTIPITGRVINLYNSAMGIGVILALGIIIYGGVRYSTSAGNPTGISDAKKWISAAFGGLAILFGAFLILNTLNTDLLTLRDPTVPQAETQEASKPSLSLPGDYEFGSCIGDGNSEIECTTGCVDTGRTPRQCMSSCYVDGAVPEIGCLDAYAATTLRDCLIISGRSHSECRSQCEDEVGNPSVLGSFGSREWCNDEIAKIIGEPPPTPIPEDPELPLPPGPIVPPDFYLTQGEYDLLEDLCGLSRSPSIVTHLGNRFIQCDFDDTDNADTWCRRCVDMGGQGTGLGVPDSCAPDDIQLLPNKACGFLLDSSR